jgi:hypothetical protein
MLHNPFLISIPKRQISKYLPLILTQREPLHTLRVPFRPPKQSKKAVIFLQFPIILYPQQNSHFLSPRNMPVLLLIRFLIIDRADREQMLRGVLLI